MSEPKYVGLDVTDIAACYRHRAAEIADGKRPKPLAAVTVEFHGSGASPALILFGGTSDLSQGECLALLLESIAVMSSAASGCNAEASN